MEHCAVCGRLVMFCGKLNRRGECQECWEERLDMEDETDSEEADVRFAQIQPFVRYKFD